MISYTTPILLKYLKIISRKGFVHLPEHLEWWGKWTNITLSYICDWSSPIIIYKCVKIYFAEKNSSTFSLAYLPPPTGLNYVENMKPISAEERWLEILTKYEKRERKGLLARSSSYLNDGRFRCLKKACSCSFFTWHSDSCCTYLVLTVSVVIS